MKSLLLLAAIPFCHSTALAVVHDGTPADVVIGQADFTSSGDSGLGSDGVGYSEPNGRLWVMDRDNQRILRFSPVTQRLYIASKNATTVTVTAANVAKGVTYEWQTTTNLTTWQSLTTFAPLTNGSQTLDANTTIHPHRSFRVREQ